MQTANGCNSCSPIINKSGLFYSINIVSGTEDGKVCKTKFLPSWCLNPHEKTHKPLKICNV